MEQPKRCLHRTIEGLNEGQRQALRLHFGGDGRGGVATLPGNYTYKASDNGVHTFTGLKLKTRGLQTITVTDTVTSSISGTLNITVT